MITEEQRQRRKQGIFASEVPYIMAGEGVRIALEKLGQIEPPDLDNEPSVQLGNILEPAVLSAYEARTGHTIMRDLDTWVHADHPWFGCHLDGFYVGASGQSVVVEAKAFSAFNRDEWGDEGTDQVPIPRVWQCMAQMAITGATEAHIPVCFVNEAALVEYLTRGTVPVSIYVIPRSESLIDRILAVCEPMWRGIEAGQVPEPTQPGDARLIYRKDDGGSVEATPDVIDAFKRLRTAKATRKSAEIEETMAAGRIQNFMRAAATLFSEGRILATWKADKRGARVFLTKEIDL